MRGPPRRGGARSWKSFSSPPSRRSRQLLAVERSMSSSSDNSMVTAGGDERDVIDAEAAAPVNPLVQMHALLRGRYRIAIILAVLGTMAGGFVGYRIQKPMYTSTGIIRIKPHVSPVLTQNDQN